MNNTQLKLLRELVSIAHDEYDGLQSYREDLDAYDKLLADMLEENTAQLEHYDTTPYEDLIVREMRDYRCSRCHFHATDHDSFCRECGARFIR